jgi:hypothetical protein
MNIEHVPDLDVTIPADDLRAAMLCAAKKDVRKYLVSVCITLKNGWLDIVATDGAMLGQISHIAVDDKGQGSVVIPLDVCKEALTGVPKGRSAMLRLKASPGDLYAISNLQAGITADFKGIDQYPDYERILHHTLQSAPSTNVRRHYDHKLVTRAYEALAAHVGLKVDTAAGSALYPRESEVGIVSIGEMLIMIMPRKPAAPYMPVWAEARRSPTTKKED